MIPFLDIGTRTADSPPDAVVEQRVFTDAKGRVVIHRAVVIPGDLPDGFQPLNGVFSFNFKTPQGPMPYRTEVPFDPTEVKTVADAFCVYDSVAAAVEERVMAELESQMLRAGLTAGIKPR